MRKWPKWRASDERNENARARRHKNEHEVDETELRQKNEVDSQGRINDAKAATEIVNMTALKDKNQDAMDDLCRLMRQTEELETAVAASTERFFVLADKVKEQSAVMRSYKDLQRLTESLLTKQMGNIRSVRKEITRTNRNLEITQTMATMKELRKHLKAIVAEQERMRLIESTRNCWRSIRPSTDIFNFVDKLFKTAFSAADTASLKDSRPCQATLYTQ